MLGNLLFNWLTRTLCVVWVSILCQFISRASHGRGEQCKSPGLLLLVSSAQTPKQQHWSPATALGLKCQELDPQLVWTCQSPGIFGGWTQAEDLALHYENYYVLLAIRGGKTSKEGGLRGDVKWVWLPNIVWSFDTGSPLCQNVLICNPSWSGLWQSTTLLCISLPTYELKNDKHYWTSRPKEAFSFWHLSWFESLSLVPLSHTQRLRELRYFEVSKYWHFSISVSCMWWVCCGAAIATPGNIDTETAWFWILVYCANRGCAWNILVFYKISLSSSQEYCHLQ